MDMSIVVFLLLLASGSSMEAGPAVYSGGSGGGGGRDDKDGQDDQNWGDWKGQCLITKKFKSQYKKKQKQQNTLASNLLTEVSPSGTLKNRMMRRKRRKRRESPWIIWIFLIGSFYSQMTCPL